VKAVFLDFDTVGPGDLDISGLRNLLPELELYATTSEQQLHKRVADAEIIIINKIRLTRPTFEQAHRLKLVCLVATGTDNVCLEAAADRGVAICNIRNYCKPSVVQHVFALILSLTHHMREYQDLLLDGAWKTSPQFCLLDYPIRELAGKTLGIVGLGNLGRGVAAVGQTFGMEVIAAQRPYRSDRPAAGVQKTEGIRRLSFRELLQQSDVVSLHCPLTDATLNLIDTGALEIMRPDALLINTARGGLVDPCALLDALRHEVIAGAGIDVLAQEPPVDGNPLIETALPNLIVTPHIAWAAREARQRALDAVVANIRAFLQGGRENRVV